MEYIQQEINIHKTKLITLINNLINTQLINEEISINNEIKKESECLISLLNIKQNTLMNQINMNNNMNFNPFMIQPNLMIPNFQPINMNQMQQQMIMNNFNNIQNNNYDNNFFLNLTFIDDSGKETIVQTNPNEKVSEIIEKYKKKANDYNPQNLFLHNGKKLVPHLIVSETSLYNGTEIIVHDLQYYKRVKLKTDSTAK